MNLIIKAICALLLIIKKVIILIKASNVRKPNKINMNILIDILKIRNYFEG